jgi:uncharacterized membrane protein YciS (DUF1049 family)
VGQHEDPKELVTLQELAVSNSYEISALVAVLERKGLITSTEVLEEIARLRAKTPKVR